jgi:hypothetical protein
VNASLTRDEPSFDDPWMFWILGDNLDEAEYVSLGDRKLVRNDFPLLILCAVQLALHLYPLCPSVSFLERIFSRAYLFPSVSFLERIFSRAKIDLWKANDVIFCHVNCPYRF